MDRPGRSAQWAWTGTVELFDRFGMKRRRSCPVIQTGSATFAGFRFPPEVILLSVRWYLRFGLSYRDLEELLAERGVDVDHVTLFRWVQRFTPALDRRGPSVPARGR